MMQAVDVSSPPNDFLCPISLELMSDPVILHSGHTYDRKSIQRWLDKGHTTCPITMKKLSDLSLTPNHMLRRLIDDWLECRRREQEKREEEVLNTLAIAVNQQPSLLASVENLRQIRLTLSDSGVLRQKILGYIEAQSLGSALANVLTKPMADEEVCVEIISILVQFRLTASWEIEGLKKGVYVRKLFDLLHNSRVDTRRNAAKLLASLDASWLWMGFKSAMESGVKRLLSNTETVHEALILLREMVMNTSTNAGSLSYAPCELMQVRHTEQRGGLTGGSCESENMQRWIVEKGFVSMIGDYLPQMNEECCEMALETMEKICSRSSCHGIGADSLAKTISNLTGVLMKHSEKCTLYAVLVLLALFKQREEKGRLNVADDNNLMGSEMRKSKCIKGTINVEGSEEKVIELQCHFMVPGLPKQLLLVLQSNHTPAVKKRCAELLKLLDSHACLSHSPHSHKITFETISTSFLH